MTAAYVGIGSNLEDPVRHVREAFAELDTLPHTRLVAKSSLYRSAPAGFAGQPDFVNAVAQLETGLPAERLLAELQDIETRHGRTRSFPNAPRTLDLDLLLYGDVALSLPALTIPHPRMHERAFVLKPLLEISPGLQARYQASLEACAGQRIERID
ncbi:MAG TPA: 2-amino-4-hydroxy-6-hydroxymethyldihydropteridine diphosphokinase [Burkholderiales bacterium]|nr:2-amino-4-hydroxy-6-hydroxymethyldihydropteridine diphosphokinase [Burkholderiales bacterium]